MKRMILFSSLVVIALLAAEAYRENLNMDWQKYQKKYKAELMRLAKTDQERVTADNYPIRMRQIVLPQWNRADRCVTCHVAMEDFRMSDMPHPWKSHPGDYLDTHDVNTVGCTLCHGGQGRAITVAEAHAQGTGFYWEQPLLDPPFIESTCTSCHMTPLAQTPTYNRGHELYQSRGCAACHQVHGAGGTQGPDLSNIGNASFHVKVPVGKDREELLGRFQHNVNLAYLYESIAMPQAQATASNMPDYKFSDQDVMALVVYMKSLTSARRLMDIGTVRAQLSGISTAVATPQVPVSGTQSSVGDDMSSRGYAIFSTSCIACHTIGEGKRVGPDLKGVAARRNREWLRRMIQKPSEMFAEKDPIAMRLLDEYQVPMADMGLSDADTEEVIQFLENPVVPTQVTTATPGQAIGGSKSTERIVTKSDIAKGRDLFQGKMRFFNGGPSCISCHDVRHDAIIGGGILAKELTTVFSRMGGAGVTAILGRPPFPVMQVAYQDKPLTEDEIFAVVSFLEEVDQEQEYHQPRDYGVKLLMTGVVGVVILLGVYAVIWHRRKRN